MSESNNNHQAQNKTRRKRNIEDDNLTDIERKVLTLLSERNEPMTVRDIAEYVLGPNVSAEAKGEDSVRTIRNALRMPKAMGLLKPASRRGSYIITERFRKFGFFAAVKTAEAWREGRELRRKEEKEN